MAISRTTASFILGFAVLVGLCHAGGYKITWTLCCTAPTFTLPTSAPGSTAGFAGESDSTSGNVLSEADATAMKNQIAAQMGVSPSVLCCVTLSSQGGSMSLSVEIEDPVDPPVLVNASITFGGNNFTTNGTNPRIVETSGGSNNTTVIIIAVIFSVLGALLFAVMAYILYRKHKAEKEKGVAGIKPISRPDDIPLVVASTTTSIIAISETSSQEPSTMRKPIADEKVRYLWNAAANAVSDPPPGGHPVGPPQPKLAFVADELTS